MGKYVVTTFGKWEDQRKKLLENLISSPQIMSKKSEKEIQQALLDDVNSAMVEISYAFMSKNISTLALRELTIQCYQVSLEVVLASLSKALDIPPEELQQYVHEFCTECHNAIETTIDDLMIIGKISVESKAQAIDQLYGENFKTLYPDLAKQLVLQDQDVIDVGKKAIDRQINPADFGENKAVICEQLIYINEIAPKVNSTEEFQLRFEAETGLTMQQYKIKVRENKSSFFLQSSPKEIQNTSADVMKLTL